MVIYPPKARDTVRALHTKFGVSFATPWLRRGTNLKMLTTSLRPLFVGAHQIALFHSTHSTAYIYIPIAASSCSRVSSFSWRPSSLPLTHARAFATSLPTSSYSSRARGLPAFGSPNENERAKRASTLSSFERARCRVQCIFMFIL